MFIRSIEEVSLSTTETMNFTFVYLIDEEVFGVLEQQHAHYDMVSFVKGNIKYHVAVEKDDYIIVDEIGIGVRDELSDM